MAKHAYRCRRCTPLIREAAAKRRCPDAGPAAMRQRAQRQFPARSCGRCPAAKAERHHRDGNPANNTPQNIEFLCRRCHMEIDGRLDALRARNRVNAKPCKNCGRVTGGVEHGHCGACRIYWNRHGVERPAERIGADGRLRRVPVAAKPCRECYRPSKPLRRGLCHACNERARRAAKRASTTSSPSERMERT